MMPVTNDTRPQCGCGRSLHQPYCDGSHARNQQQLLEWQAKCKLDKTKEK